MRHLKKFNEGKNKNPKDEKDIWWIKNHKRLVGLVRLLQYEDWQNIVLDGRLDSRGKFRSSDMQYIMDSTAKHQALYILAAYSIEEIESMIEEYNELSGLNESRTFKHNILPEEALKELESYVDANDPKNKIEVYPDPQVEGTYALKIYREEDDYTFNLLWNKGGYDEVDFDEFPPKSGDLKFFI